MIEMARHVLITFFVSGKDLIISASPKFACFDSKLQYARIRANINKPSDANVCDVLWARQINRQYKTHFLEKQGTLNETILK